MIFTYDTQISICEYPSLSLMKRKPKAKLPPTGRGAYKDLEPATVDSESQM